jgi:hypothetical protein
MDIIPLYSARQSLKATNFIKGLESPLHKYANTTHADSTITLQCTETAEAKSISSSGAKLARCKTPNQRAIEVLRAPFSSGHSQKL